MASVNALSVALFNAAAGGYSADMQANPAAYAAVAGAVLEKNLSSNAAFVQHLLANFGVATTSAVYAEAQTALLAMVAGTGRANSTVSAIDFLAAQTVSSAYGSIAMAFQAKVASAAAFSTANATETDVSKLIAAVTGVDTDVVAANAAFAAGAASRDTEVIDLVVSVAALSIELTAAQAATTAANAAAATAATDAAAALAAANTAAATAATDAAAALAAANTAAATAATQAAAALAAANATITLIDDTAFATESAAAAAATTAANAAAATDAAAALAAANTAATDAAAALAAANATITALQNPAGGTFVLTTSANVVIGVSGGDDAITGTGSTYQATDVIVDGSTTDNDTLTITATDEVNVAPLVVGIENVVVNINAFGTSNADAAEVGFDASSFSLVKTVTFDVTKDNSSITDLDFEGAFDGITVNTSSEFEVVNIDGDANANIILSATGGNDIDVVATTGAFDDVTVTSSKATGAVAVDTDATDTVTITTATTGTTTITADDADTVTAVAAGVLVINADAATALTASAAGTTTDSTITSDDGDLLEVSLSGNGAAVLFNLEGAEEIATVNVVGTQAVTIEVDANDVDEITVVDTSSATSTLQFTAADSVDLSGAAVDVIKLNVDFDGDVITVASGAVITITEDQDAGTGTTITADEDTADTNSVTINIADDASTSTASAPDTLILTEFNSAIINALDTSTALTLTDADFGTTDVTVNGFGTKGVTFAGSVAAGTLTLVSSGAVSFGTSTLDVEEIDASAVSAAVDLDLIGDNAEPLTITTGSGADSINIATAVQDYTISLGAGNDSVTINVDVTTSNTITIDGGAGTNTLIHDGDADLSGVVLSNFSIIRFDAAEGDSAFVESQLDGQGYVIQAGKAGDDITVSLESVDIDLSGLTITNAGANAFVGTFVISNTGFTGLALTITGSDAIDEITGGNKNDILDGGDGDNVIDGGSGSDVITAGDGDDTLNGGAGNDTITAGAGDDTIDGDEGADTMTGGDGDDIFVINSGDSTSAAFDVITDFTIADDELDFAVSAGNVVADEAAFSVSSADDDAGTVTAVVDDGIITLAGADKANIDSLAEFLAVAELVVAAAEAGADADVLIGFEFNGSTFVAEYVWDDSASTATFSNLVKLTGVTDIDALASAAATDTVVVI